MILNSILSLLHLMLSVPFSSDMLIMIDAMLARATKNKAFNTKIPLLDISINDMIDVASIFTSALFEFFVMVQPFEDRAIKSLSILG